MRASKPDEEQAELIRNLLCLVAFQCFSCRCIPGDVRPPCIFIGMYLCGPFQELQHKSALHIIHMKAVLFDAVSSLLPGECKNGCCPLCRSRSESPMRRSSRRRRSRSRSRSRNRGGDTGDMSYEQYLEAFEKVRLI